MAKHGKHSARGYVIVAIILAIITYIEYYIVEFPQAWLGPSWTLFWILAMSIAKFVMVLWYFMHLKDDDKAYTGFFSSGMVIGLGTFTALAFLFLLPRAVAPVVAEASAPAMHGAAYDSYAKDLPEEVRANIETDGASRPLSEQSGTPRPADRSLSVTPPAANGSYSVDLAEPSADTESVAQAPAAAAPAAPAAAAAPAVPAAPAAAAAPAATAVVNLANGQRVYASCAGCHGPAGLGIAGIFPQVAGHLGDLSMVEGGRSYVANMMLYGLQGPISVRGSNYNGLMPGWASLSDVDIADVLNYIVIGFDSDPAPDDFAPYSATEIAAERGQNLSAAAVLERRNALGPIPLAQRTSAASEPAAVSLDWDRALGQESYTANCSACHQATGAGIPGAFPPVAQHAAALYSAEGGRDYLIKLMLFGLMGAIEVGGVSYAGMMPAVPHLGDDTIAAIINHSVAVLSDEPAGFTPITAREVGAQRGAGLNLNQMLELRGTLGLD